MLTDNYQNIKENLPLLLPYFSANNTLEADVEAIGAFMATLMPLQAAILVRSGREETAAVEETAVWCMDGEPVKSQLEQKLQEHVEKFSCTSRSGLEMDTEICALLGFSSDDRVTVQRIDGQAKPWGFLVLQRETGLWQENEQAQIAALCGMMGAALAIRMNLAKEKLSNFVLNQVLDNMKTSIYITEVETDRILFMNQVMKKDFNLENAEGQTCWKVLQHGMKKRCKLCPIEQLKKEPSAAIPWEEKNTVNGRIYQNYDSLIRWVDGSMVHLQQSIDVTELKAAYIDELTQMPTRRPGIETLELMLKDLKRTGKVMTICLCNINERKEINDLYGTAEGDRLLSTVAAVIKSALREHEFAFRLSGDELIAVMHTRKKTAKQRIERVIKKLRDMEPKYEMGICYGLVEITAEHSISVKEVLFFADERMYEQKKQLHILRNERLRLNAAIQSDGRYFDYDQKRLYDALIQSTDDYLYICNMKTGVFRYPQAMVEEFDLPGEVIENAAAVWGARVHAYDRAAFLEANQEIADGHTLAHCVEYRARNRSGEWVWVRCRGHLELDENNEPVLFAGFITNLGKKNKIDYLTGLFNKLEFEEKVRHLIGEEADNHFGVMVLGIDDLKHINDLYDRIYGDEVIRIVSQRIQSLLPAEASVYRLDGDEFGIIVRDIERAGMKKIYRTLYHCFENQQEYDGKKYYSTLSAGCVFYPQDADDYLDLIKYAGYSLEHAKAHGKKRCVFFSTDILGHRTRMLEMVEALRESIENDFAGFSLCFQPLVQAQDGELTGAEALARWTCAAFGDVSPIEFIPLLEQTGMIVPMGKWVFRTAVHACKKWCVYKPDFVVDVNLSYRQLQGSDFVPFMRDVLIEEEYAACNLVVELTESHFAEENQQIQAILAEIRGMGVRIAMDDFGTGYSSLGILKDSSVDIVKIDKTFVRDIRTSNFDATFIRFVVALCHDVSIKVCLEGVETEEEYQVVSQMGLDMIQGFLFGHPLTEQEFDLKYFNR